MGGGRGSWARAGGYVLDRWGGAAAAAGLPLLVAFLAGAGPGAEAGRPRRTEVDGVHGLWLDFAREGGQVAAERRPARAAARGTPSPVSGAPSSSIFSRVSTNNPMCK